MAVRHRSFATSGRCHSRRRLSITLEGVRGDGQHQERDTIGASVEPTSETSRNVYSGIGNDAIQGTDERSDLRGHYGHDTIYGFGMGTPRHGRG
jgi:hypothetical protein